MRHKGFKLSEETKKKIKQKALDRWKSQTFRKKVMKNIYNGVNSEISKKKRVATRKAYGWWKDSLLTKHNMSLSKKGKIFLPEIKAKIYTPQFAEKISQTKKRLYAQGKILPLKGDKNPMWKGGISYEDYSLDFSPSLKRKIRERDNFQCQICLSPSRIVHHIDYNKKNSCPENLIVLCKTHHSQTNHHREKWIKFFQEKSCAM